MIIITEVILSSENIFFWGVGGRETLQFQMSLPRLCHPSPS